MKKQPAKFNAADAFFRWIVRFAVPAFIVVSAACSVITDFDESRIKTNLNEILYAEQISLKTEADVGYIILEFAERFSPDEMNSLAQLIGEEIQLDLGSVANSYRARQITQTRVVAVPAESGEYQLLMGSGGYKAAITFYNGPADDPLVSPGEPVRIVIYAEKNPIVATDEYVFEFNVDENDSDCN